MFHRGLNNSGPGFYFIVEWNGSKKGKIQFFVTTFLHQLLFWSKITFASLLKFSSFVSDFFVIFGMPFTFKNTYFETLSIVSFWRRFNLPSAHTWKKSTLRVKCIQRLPKVKESKQCHVTSGQMPSDKKINRPEFHCLSLRKSLNYLDSSSQIDRENSKVTALKHTLLFF